MKPLKQKYTGSQLVINNALVEKHAPLVKRIAYHLSARLPPSVIVDDLIQAGMMGLLDSARNYDVTQGASFETYATIRVRGSMLDELRRNDWAPKSVHKKARDLAKAMQTIESSTGRDARDHEIAKMMDITIQEYHQILQDANTCRVLNFDEFGISDEFSNMTEDTKNCGPMEGLQKEELQSVLSEAITTLPERERLIISLYYDVELNLREVGTILGVSESRVSQLLSQSHLRLRARLSELLDVPLGT
ncbi:MAG: RNA polymerase sigma factor FliA [Thiohalomonadales bacterium]